MSDAAETAYAKLNLALHVRERMPDGYHRIETVFAFCEDGDEITGEAADSVSVSQSGPFAAALDSADNLVARAAAMLAKMSGTKAGAAIHLRKSLPLASGLGGGSADAAATLRLLNRLWGLDWPPERLEDVAGELGSDVPACVRSEPAIGEGRGDQLKAAELGLAGTPALLVNPRVGLPTAQVFDRWDGVDRGPLGNWRHGRNDLEAAAMEMVPQIGGILAWLSAQSGSECVRMSGSGATCFALFETESKRDQAALAVPREWWSLATRLR